MELNGKPVDELLAEQFKSMQEDADKKTPEMEAKFAEEERKRLYEEALDRVEASNRNADIPRRFWNASFSKYPSEISEEARELCLKENTDTIFIMYGTTGRGKTTTLCSAIHARAFEGAGSSYYFTMRNLEMVLRRCRTYGTDEDEVSFMRRLSEIPFLCLDEVGTCSNQSEEATFLRNIISARFDNCLPTWIATNLTPIQFKAYLSGMNISELNSKSGEELKKLNDDLTNNVVILNRIKSVAVEETLVGESYRGVNNGDNSDVR